MNEPKPQSIPIHPQTLGIMGAYLKREKEEAIDADFARAMKAAGLTLPKPPAKR